MDWILKWKQFCFIFYFFYFYTLDPTFSLKNNLPFMKPKKKISTFFKFNFNQNAPYYSFPPTLNIHTRWRWKWTFNLDVGNNIFLKVIIRIHFQKEKSSKGLFPYYMNTIKVVVTKVKASAISSMYEVHLPIKTE